MDKTSKKREKVASVYAFRKSKVESSLYPNKDRIAALKILAEFGPLPLLAPEHILRVFGEIGDIRMTAFILCLAEETVADAVKGDPFPTGLKFSFMYVSEALGVPRRRVSSFVKSLRKGSVTEKAVMTREDVLSFIERDKTIGADVCSLAGLQDAFGYKLSINTLRKISAVIGAELPVGGRKMYDVDLIKKFTSMWIVGGNNDIVDALIEIDQSLSRKYVKTVLSGTLLSIHGARLNLLPVDYKDLVKEGCVEGGNIKEMCKAISTRLESRNEEYIAKLEKYKKERR